MRDVVKHITELFAVILINVGAFYTPLEAVLKLLVLFFTIIFTVVQTINILISIKKKREDAKRHKTD